jgi:tetratricopeptide (TPR) repeat protein
MGEKKRRLAMGVQAPPSPAAPSVDDLLSGARDLLAMGNARDAVGRAQQALALDPGRPEALHLAGLSCLAVGAAGTGIGLLRAAVAARPQDGGFRSGLGRALAGTGQLREAAEQLRLACEGSADAEVSRDLGAVLVHLGRRRQAEEAYARAAELAPGRADVHEALARLRYERDALAEAEESFGRALALDPGLIHRLNIGSAHGAGQAAATGAEDDLFPRGSAPAQPAWHAVRPGPAATGRSSTSSAEEVLRTACEARSMRVIDDFLDDPLGYRRRALQLDFLHSSKQAGINYPGLQTAAQPCDAIMRRIARVLGRDIKWDSPDNGAFRVSPADATARCDIHVDSEVRTDIFAAVLYLNLPEHCRGGTLFWRHRATGWERRPSPEQLAGRGYASFSQFEKRWMPVARQRPFGELQQERDAAWECLLEVPMRFNRLIVYRSDFFHSIGELFGERPEDSRFVQLFFFEATLAL